MATAVFTPLTPLLPNIKIIAEATPASDVSGAIAAPTFAQPKTII